MKHTTETKKLTIEMTINHADTKPHCLKCDKMLCRSSPTKTHSRTNTNTDRLCSSLQLFLSWFYALPVNATCVNIGHLNHFCCLLTSSLYIIPNTLHQQNDSSLTIPRFPDCRCTSLEHSVAERSFIQFSVNFQVSTPDRAFLTKLRWLMRLREFSLSL